MTSRPDKRELVRFLLNDLPENRREEIELAYMEDDDLFREILAVEQDLIQSYLRNELGADDRQRFDASLQKSPLRRKAVETTLSAVSDPKDAVLPALQSSGFTELWKSLLFLIAIQRRPAKLLMGGLAGAACLAFVWLSWNSYTLRRNMNQSLSREAAHMGAEEDLRRQIVGRDGQLLQLQRDLDDERRLRDSLEAQLRALPQTGPVVMSAKLLPGPGDAAALARGLDSIPIITIAPNIQFVSFELKLDLADDYSAYRIELRDQTKEIKNWNGIRSVDNRGEQFLNLTVMSNLLPEDSCTLLVRGIRDSRAELTATYRFTVLRRAPVRKPNDK